MNCRNGTEWNTFWELNKMSNSQFCETTSKVQGDLIFLLLIRRRDIAKITCHLLCTTKSTFKSSQNVLFLYQTVRFQKSPRKRNNSRNLPENRGERSQKMYRWINGSFKAVVTFQMLHLIQLRKRKITQKWQTEMGVLDCVV